MNTVHNENIQWVMQPESKLNIFFWFLGRKRKIWEQKRWEVPKNLITCRTIIIMFRMTNNERELESIIDWLAWIWLPSFNDENVMSNISCINYRVVHDRNENLLSSMNVTSNNILESSTKTVITPDVLHSHNSTVKLRYQLLKTIKLWK